MRPIYAETHDGFLPLDDLGEIVAAADALLLTGQNACEHEAGNIGSNKANDITGHKQRTGRVNEGHLLQNRAVDRAALELVCIQAETTTRRRNHT